jgi:hypothetical protein
MFLLGPVKLMYIYICIYMYYQLSVIYVHVCIACVAWGNAFFVPEAYIHSYIGTYIDYDHFTNTPGHKYAFILFLNIQKRKYINIATLLYKSDQI